MTAASELSFIFVLVLSHALNELVTTGGMVISRFFRTAEKYCESTIKCICVSGLVFNDKRNCHLDFFFNFYNVGLLFCIR